MFRHWRLALAVPLVFGAAGSAWTQVSRNPPPNRPGPAGNAAEAAAATSGKFLAIPGFAPLSMEAVHREIGLTSEQKRQLKAVSDSLVASIQRLRKSFIEFSRGRAANASKRSRRSGYSVGPQRPTQG